MKFLIDSDVIIWALRGQKETLELLRTLQSAGIPACSPISIIEVKLGAKSGEERKTTAFLDSLKVYPLDCQVADKASERITECRRKGTTLGIPDAIIAATCIIHGLTLVTYNTKHYPLAEIKFYP
ncbi:MAG: type II toxin-antitoxin system VapC family toxin [Dehalococcoidia bacterium]|nr:type II toxin-antitoxin system VapC family toxin [Dehalococcoidia bacterium]MDH5781323.1 type II toxin-antitoxin system VapC family toxin [Dehalococcoidia bacterium]